jgi:hypothetical protein
VLQVLLVLLGAEVAGEGVDRFEQARDGAQRDALQIRLFDVVALDAGEDFREDGEVLVSVLRRGARPIMEPMRSRATNAVEVDTIKNLNRCVMRLLGVQTLPCRQV